VGENATVAGYESDVTSAVYQSLPRPPCQNQERPGCVGRPLLVRRRRRPDFGGVTSGLGSMRLLCFHDLGQSESYPTTGRVTRLICPHNLIINLLLSSLHSFLVPVVKVRYHSQITAAAAAFDANDG